MNSAKIVPFVDMQVEKPSTYKMIKNDGTEELVKLEFAPGIIYQEGTKDNAENFNTIQNNAVYRVDGTRVLEATEEIYDINIVNYNNYTPNDLTIIMNVDVSNTSNSPKIRLNNIKYNIVNESGNVPINFLINKNTFIFVLDFNKKTAKITSGDYKLKPATSSSIGGVKIGGSMTVSADGTINAILNQTTADSRYVNITGDTMTGLLNGPGATFSGDVKIENLAIDAQVGHIAISGNYAYSECRVEESDSSENFFRMWSDHNYNVLEYYGSGGLSGTSKRFILHNKSTGVVSYAGGNYGTINGSTATFSGNVTAPSITIGGYVVTIV